MRPNSSTPLLYNDDNNTNVCNLLFFAFRLAHKRAVQGPRGRRAGNRNPLRSLAARDDLISEYTEIKGEHMDRGAKRMMMMDPSE